MNVNYIRKLIRLMEESEIETLEVSRWGRTVKLTQKAAPTGNGHQPGAVIVQSAPAPAPALQTVPVAADVPASDTAAPKKDNLVAITSPMVGTFYAAPSPDSNAYVSLNERITKGQVVCIVEAMKLMNEIEAEVSGRIAEICVENAKPVEFGQTLFLIDPD